MQTIQKTQKKQKSAMLRLIVAACLVVGPAAAAVVPSQPSEAALIPLSQPSEAALIPLSQPSETALVPPALSPSVSEASLSALALTAASLEAEGLPIAQQALMHKSYLIALRNATSKLQPAGTAAGVELFTIPDCGINLGCWKNAIDGAIHEIDNLAREVQAKIAEAANLAAELMQIKPVIEDVGRCLKTLPGAKPPLDALREVGNLVNSGSAAPVTLLPQYMMQTYVAPMIERVVTNFAEVTGVMQTGIEQLKALKLIKNNSLDAQALAQVPAIVIPMMRSVIMVDETVQCLMENDVSSRLLDKLEDTALEPLFLQLSMQVGNAINALWTNLMGPDGVVGRAVTSVVAVAEAQLAVRASEPRTMHRPPCTSSTMCPAQATALRVCSLRCCSPSVRSSTRRSPTR